MTTHGEEDWVTFSMRPRLVWRLVWPVLALIAVFAAVVSLSEWRLGLGALLSTFQAFLSWRQYVCVEDGVIYRRGLIGWAEPVLLDALCSVEFTRVWGFREPYKHLELVLLPRSGDSMTFSLRWWSNTERLLRQVARSASEPTDDQRHRQWRFEVDEETAQRLAPFARLSATVAEYNR